MGYCYIRDTVLYEFIPLVIIYWMLTGCQLSCRVLEFQ